MPSTKCITVYTFEELSDEAKNRARYDHMEVFGYSWGDDAIKSMKALAEHFGGIIMDYGICWDQSGPSFMKFAMPVMKRKKIDRLLGELGEYNPETLKGTGECKLTGYCMDEAAIDGFRKAFIGGTEDLTELMNSAFRSWLKACQADFEYQYSDEALAETSEANGYEYHKNGELV